MLKLELYIVSLIQNNYIEHVGVVKLRNINLLSVASSLDPIFESVSWIFGRGDFVHFNSF